MMIYIHVTYYPVCVDIYRGILLRFMYYCYYYYYY